MTSAKSWKELKIAVTGINAHAENPGPGLAVARCLKEHPDFAGEIIGLAYDALDAGLYDRDNFSAAYLIPYPSAGEEALMERIAAIHAEEKFDVIIPCLDSELQTFIRLKNELENLGVRMLIPDRDQFNMRAKTHLVELCRSIAVNVPKSKTLSDPGFFDRCQSEGFNYPLIVKGIFYDAVIVYNALEAKAAFARLAAKWGYPCLVQEVIKGDELNLSGVGNGKGELASFVMMSKRALTDKGKAWAGVTVEDEEMLKVSKKLVAALKWRGPLEVEAMRGQDGKIYLIEINPRFPSWIYLSHAVGRNLPVAVLKTLTGEELNMPEHKTGTFFIRYARELTMELEDFEAVMMLGASGKRRVQTC